MRQHLTVLLAAAVVLVLGYGGYHVLFAEAEYQRLTVASVAGEVTRTDERGAVVPAGPGDSLHASAAIRVGAEGHALLVAGEGAQLMLEADTTVRVLAASRRGVQVELDEGRVQATVQPGSRVLGVRAGSRTARTEAGAFRVARDGDGYVRVAAEAGAVSVDGPDGAEALAVGQRLDVDPGGRAAISEAVLEEILLEVQWPEPTPGDTPVPVDGQTTPHAKVAIRGPGGTTELRADASGHFEGTIHLPPGDHVVRIDAADDLSPARTEERTLTRPAPVPVATTEVRFGG